MQRIRGPAAIVATILAVLLVPAAGASGSTAPCRGGNADAPNSAFDVISVRTLNVAFKPAAKSYSIGDVVKMAVTVTRPAPEDPANQGVPMPPGVSQPADGVTVGVGLHIGPVFSPGYNVTGSNGKTVVSIKIPPYAHPAVVGVDAYAYNILAQSPCYTIQEDGYSHKTKVFTVTK